MSGFVFGCGKDISVFVPSRLAHLGQSGKMRQFKCGSTAYDGGVNQCTACTEKHPVSLPHEEESDLDWFERQQGDAS